MNNDHDDHGMSSIAWLIYALKRSRLRSGELMLRP